MKITNLRRIWALCAPYHWPILTIIMMLVIQHSVSASLPFFVGGLVTAVTQHDKAALTEALTALTVLWCCRVGIVFLRERHELSKIDFAVSDHLARISMEKFFNISLGQHRGEHSLIKQSVIRKGETAVNSVLMLSIYELLPTILMIMIPTVFLLMSVPIIGLYVLGAICCFVIYTYMFNMRFAPRLRKYDSQSNAGAKKYGEVLQNAEVVYVNTQEERIRNECDETNIRLTNIGKPLWLSYTGWYFSGQLFNALAQAGGIALAAVLTYQGKINSGTFVALTMWIGSSLGTLSNISNVQRNLAKNIAPVEKYFRFLDYVPTIVVPKNPVQLEKLQGRIEFRNVSFSYSMREVDDGFNADTVDDDDEVTELQKFTAIQDVSFVLEKGKRYAIVGPSGSGKSTLIGLILRAFDPQAGSVLIDGIDMRELDYRKLRAQIGLVPQTVDLFDSSLRYNITFGLNGSASAVTDDELNRIAEVSRISEFSSKLEKGWDTMLGERGIKLSGGQRQRVGIARALIKNPHVLIFDEATSSLDTENEQRIRESIREASVGKTTIIIAHRLATVRDAEKIFVFDQGRLVGQGSHEMLLQTNEYYQRLVHNQVIMA